MATLEELARLDAEISEAEERALRGLVDCLRQAVVELPIQSRLAYRFADEATLFDRIAEHTRGRATTASLALMTLRSRVARDVDYDDESEA